VKQATLHLWSVAIGLGGLIATAPAQTGGDYDLRWNTQDAGAATITGANGYVVVGTIGQPDAGVAQSGNGGFVLRGGFWPGAHNAGDTIFRGTFESGP
jgi:hypothetical protein